MQYVMQLTCMQNTSWIKKAHLNWEEEESIESC